MEILRRQGIALMQEYRVPVVVEVIRERVTNISMGGADIANVVEFEELAERGDDVPPRSPGRTEPIR